MPVTTRSATKSPPKSPRVTAKAPRSPRVTAKAPRSPRVTAKAPRSPRVTAKAPRSPRVTAKDGVATRVPRAGERDPYYSPFWPPSNYQVPGKAVITSPTPAPRTMEKYRAFIVELKEMLKYEKVIDRDSNSQLFAELIEEQEKGKVLDIYKLRPYKIICFVSYDHTVSNIFHKGNGMFGNYAFRKLLQKNKMSIKKRNDDMIYIHK